jgi:aspartate carbamoyltransferase regulatory subunit
MYLESGKWGKKDIIKIENKELTQAEADKIALLGPHTTISIIRDYRVVAKRASAIPQRIAAVVRCPNPACITNHEAVPTDFHVDVVEPLRVRCEFCERVVLKDEMELL